MNHWNGLNPKGPKVQNPANWGTKIDLATILHQINLSYQKVIFEGILLGREIPNPKVSKNLADDLLLETLLRTKPVTSLKWVWYTKTGSGSHRLMVAKLLDFDLVYLVQDAGYIDFCTPSFRVTIIMQLKPVFSKIRTVLNSYKGIHKYTIKASKTWKHKWKSV